RDGGGGVRAVRFPFQSAQDLMPMAELSATTEIDNRPPPIEVRNLTMSYGGFVVMRDLNFTVRKHDIFVIMGGSGSGKSTLLRHLIGLRQPAAGEIFYSGVNLTRADAEERELMVRRFGVLY